MTSIFVGNLSFETTEAELERAFARHGRVSSVRIVTDRGTGTPKGFGFVSMPGMDDAEEAIARMNGQSIGGREIRVNEAQSRNSGGSTSSGPSGPAPGRRSALLDLL